MLDRYAAIVLVLLLPLLGLDTLDWIYEGALEKELNSRLLVEAKGVAGLGKAGGDGQGGSDKAGQQVPPEVYNALSYAGSIFLLILSVPFVCFGLNKLLNKIEDCFGCGPSTKRSKLETVSNIKNMKSRALANQLNTISSSINDPKALINELHPQQNQLASKSPIQFPPQQSKPQNNGELYHHHQQQQQQQTLAGNEHSTTKSSRSLHYDDSFGFNLAQQLSVNGIANGLSNEPTMFNQQLQQVSQHLTSSSKSSLGVLPGVATRLPFSSCSS